MVWQKKLRIPSSRSYLHISSRKQGQDNSPQEGASFVGSIIKFEEVSFFTQTLVLKGTRTSSFKGFPPQLSESDLAEKRASRRHIFLSKQNSQTLILENQGFSNKPQVIQIWHQVRHLKLIRSESLLFPFEVLI